MKEKGDSGFTLIETLVVVSITVILTTMALGYTRQNEDRIALFTEQAKISGMLQRAKALALQGIERGEGSEGVCYGIMFHRPTAGSHYATLFRSAVPKGGSACEEGASEEEVLRQALDARVFVDPASPERIVFRGPRIRVFIDGNPPPSDETEIVLRVRDSATRIFIGRGGSISIR